MTLGNSHWSLIFLGASARFVELPGLLVAFWVRKVHKSSPGPWVEGLLNFCCWLVWWEFLVWKKWGELRQLLADTGCAHLAVGNLWNLRWFMRPRRFGVRLWLGS